MCAVATPDDPYAMKMLFVDEEGEKIEAVVQKHYMHKFAKLVVEGEVYKVTNFTVNRNGGKFRASPHDYKLSFNASTRVVLCEKAIIPFMGLSLLKSNDIKETRGSFDKLFGEFCPSFVTEGRNTRLMLVDLIDEMGQIRCAIFGELVDTLNSLLALPRVGLPVMIIQLARVNLYKGEVGIQNLMNASKLLWNPDIPEAVSFKESLVVHEVESDTAISIVSEKYRPVSLRDQFLNKLYPNKTVRELIHLLEGHPIVMSAKWRYKVKLVVSDGIDSIPLILFDSECYYLLRRQCKDLIAEQKCHKVRKICSDESIIKEFKELVEEDTPLKLKFAPTFSKLDQSEARSCVIDLSPQCNSVGSEVAATPPSAGQCSSSTGAVIVPSKRGSDEPVDPPSDKQKRTRLRAVKVERP
ncbi:Nucleic acid-binding, OB-fold [Sesbania bispinosa]|nr:Nucleic acid-binding, OB-fold [Sesbania bispinosa]